MVCRDLSVCKYQRKTRLGTRDKEGKGLLAGITRDGVWSG